ncbi:hypothetical protein AB0D33_40725 [Streptomyces sp. NPDC048404]|uniref:hypothetical protein n=1 Tax=unclassified Streptomyces TaxID=2593676 RepID=UPI00343B2AE9
MTPAGALRRLSGTEAACAYRHALTGGHTQAATRLTVAAVFSPAYVERAVAWWARGFRALSLRIVEEGGSLWFHEVPGIAPEQLLQEMCTAADPGPGHDGSGGVLASGAGDVLTAGGPLWRLGVGHDPAAAATHLLLTCHPALCDGPSTARLLRALLDALLGQGPAGRGSPGYRQDPAPDADELTYRPPPPPYPGPVPTPAPRAPRAPRAGGPESPAPVPGAVGRTKPPGPDSGVVETVAASGGAGCGAPVSLTARQSARLTAWCGRHRITAGQLFAAALADSCARAAGQEEVALLTSVSLRRRYAECARVSEVGCFVNVVRATVRAGDGGALVDHARAYGLAVRAADAAWHPVRQDHARIRRAVEDETAAAADGGLGFRVTQEGCADTVLGHHAALVTWYDTTPYGATPYGTSSCGSLSYGSPPYGTLPYSSPPYGASSYGSPSYEASHRTTSYETVHGTTPYAVRGTTPYAVRGTTPYDAVHGTSAYGAGGGTSGYGTAYGISPGAAAHGAGPGRLGVLHLSRFKGAFTLSLGMPGLPQAGAGAPTATGCGGLTASEIAAELTARALDLVA